MFAFTVDLEDWYHGLEIPIQSWASRENRVRKGLDKVLELLDDTQTKATFFTLGWIADQYPEIIKELDAAGHEIGSHSYWHRKVYELTKQEFKEDILRTNASISNIIGKPVTGFRAPYFSITKDSIWALEILRDCGYTYDCSISPVVTWRYGIPGAQENLYYMPDYDMWEYGLSTFSIIKKKFGIGGAYLRIFPIHFTKAAYNSLLASHTDGMFYCHPWEYDPDHPYTTEIPKMARITHYMSLNSMYDKTKELLNSYKFTTVSNIIASNRTKPLASNIRLNH